MLNQSFVTLTACLLALGPVGQTEPPKPADLNQVHADRMAGRYERAVASYQAFLKDPAHHLDATCGLVRCYLETGRYEDARKTLDHVKDRGRASAEWHRLRAKTLAAVGQYEQAIDHARKAIETDSADLRAHYLLGILYETVGRREDAIKTYGFFDRLVTRRLPTDAPGLTTAAGGFLRYSVLTHHESLSNRTIHTLQELLQPAYERLDPGYWPARIASANLLRSKFKNDQAAEDYEAALKLNANLAVAHVGLGCIALDEWDFEQADRRIELAKGSNPNSVAALQLEAALRLTERRYEQARTAVESALTVNPTDVESLGLGAAAAFALNDGDAVERFRQQAYRVSTLPSPFHRALADTMAALRQFPQSERQYRLAIETDPTDPHPRTELGLMYMQWGEETKARQVLTDAWRLDEFDARTHRTLDLLDKLSAFARHETEHFVIKYDAESDALLPRYFADYLEGLHQELCEEYDWRLTDKTIVEFFPTQRMFAVRITGKPWIHTVGACTGRVIALASPRPSPQLHGPYPVADVLRHEFTHTVTLGATRNRITHWFTEGLAVLQEGRPRSYAWRRLLVEAIRRDGLFTLESIDWGFMRPRRPQDRTLAYAQSEWMCEYIRERFGSETINRMLRAFRGGKSHREVVQETLGVAADRLDTAFAAWARQHAQAWGFDLSKPEDVERLRADVQRQPDNADLLARLAKAELDAGEPARALDAAASALLIDDDHVPALTLFGQVLYDMLSAESDPKERENLARRLEPAMAHLAEIAPDREIASRTLGKLALDRREYQRAVAFFSRAMGLHPRHPDVARGLGAAYLELGDFERALPVLLESGRDEWLDAETASTIGMIHARNDRLGDARQWYLRALYVNPFDVGIHGAYAGILMRQGETAAAAGEYEVLCELRPRNVGYFEQAAIAHHKLGDTDSARRYARRAVELDPTTAVGSLLPASER